MSDETTQKMKGPPDPGKTTRMDPNKTRVDPNKTVRSPSLADQTAVNREMAGRTAINEEMAGRTVIDKEMTNRTLMDPNKTVVEPSRADKTIVRPDAEAKAAAEEARAAARAAKTPKPAYADDTIRVMTKRKGLLPPEKTPETPAETQRMTRPGKGKFDRFKSGDQGAGNKELRGVPREKIFSKEELRILDKAGKRLGGPSLGSRPRGFGGRGLAIGLGGAVVGLLAFATINWALDRAQERAGEIDMSTYLPENTEVIWGTAVFTRVNREESDPFYEPNVFSEQIRVISPKNDVIALGIALENLPEVFSSDINVNGTGFGNSDWLCAPTVDYLICRSVSEADILMKNGVAVVSMQFHVPAKQLREFMQTQGGAHPVFVVTAK